ncbi:MAG TPA: hypothetical protein VGQ52_01175 [Gemmatimonadaceae bacterium]|nr:hypothetical protein [Gemmatimonadaceae bacterium]
MLDALRRSRRDLTIVGVFAVWLTAVLTLDVGAGIWPQRALGAVSWLILFGLLRGEGRTERAQVVVVVMFATAVEYTASPLLGLYTYRLHNVPTFVPPGHGGLYLAALALGRSEIFTRYGKRLCALVTIVGAMWVLWGVTLSDRKDWLGVLMFTLFVRTVAAGRAPSVFASTFILTAALELLGTSLGNWTWALRDPTGLVSIGNPPSGIAGGYCIFDAVALAGGPALGTFMARMRDSFRGARLRAALRRQRTASASLSPPSGRFPLLPSLE